MEFRLLGPLEVCSDGELIVLAGPKQRAILTILLLNANQVVPRARLLAEVWGERAPGSQHSLDVHISRLRKALAPGGEGSALVRRGRGYLLCVQEGTLDLVRFEQRIAAGQQALAEGRPAAAAALLDDGLGLWRGEPLAEFADQAFAAAELGRAEGAPAGCAGSAGRGGPCPRARGRYRRRSGVAGQCEPVSGAVSRSADAGALPGRTGRPRRWRSMRTRAACSSTNLV